MPNPVLPRRILVTGADGFIGRHMVRDLIAHGQAVSAATRQGGEVEGVRAAATGEIGPETDWRPALEGITHVVHLAGRAHVLLEREADPQAAFDRVNVAGTLRLAEQARDMDVRQFIFVSSISVYDPALIHLSGGMAPDPKTYYGRSKWAAEQALGSLADEKTALTILRPPLVYGPGAGARFGQLLWLAHLGLPLPFGSLRNARSFLHVSNLTDAVAQLLDHEDALGRTFLIRDGEDISTPEAIQILAAAMRRPTGQFKLPPSMIGAVLGLAGRGDDWRKFSQSLTLEDTPLRQALGWTAPVGMRQGLAETGRWYADRMREKTPTK